MEERKGLRLELREVRRKIFEAPISTPKKQSSSPASSVNVAKENAKNLDLNGNNITLNTSSSIKSTTSTKNFSTNSKVSVSLGIGSTKSTSTPEETNKMNSSGVTRQSRLFDDNNNDTPKSEPEAPKANGIKLKVNTDDEVPTLRSRDPTDRAARRARRAQQQREMSIDTDSLTALKSATPEPAKIEESVTKTEDVAEPEPTPAPLASIVIEKPKEEKKIEVKLNSGRPTATTSPFKTSNNFPKSNSSSTLTTNDKNAAGLKRSVTWGAKDRPGAAKNIGKALNKFGGQVSLFAF